MMIKNSISLFLLLVLITGCSEIVPFEDTRREAGQIEPVGQSKPERIAVCYNAWWDDMDEVRQLAEQACSKQKKHAVDDGISYFNCRLMTPSTAFFTCK